ncbi:MAG: carbohydrate-binding domain-containing protein [Oscillospiraceae bacterium]|nr:carbohydrate-binding domain-containing protein [Oscillospiraceae bacterium]
MKKTFNLKTIALVLTIAITLAMTSFANTDTNITFVRGDVNEDGNVTIADALEILKKLAKMSNEIDKPSKYGQALNDLQIENAYLKSQGTCPDPSVHDETHECPEWPGICPSCTVWANHTCPPVNIPANDPLGQSSGTLPDETQGARTITFDGTNITGTDGTIVRRAPVEAGIPQSVQQSRLEIRRGGTYILTGNFNGHIYINARTPQNAFGERGEERVRLILNNVNITSTTGPAIHIYRSETTEIVIQDGTTNTLTDAANYVELYSHEPIEERTTEPRGVIYSRRNIEISGRGTLNINGNFRDGIHTRDELEIFGGKITVNAVPAPSSPNQGEGNALHGRDGVRIDNGDIKITAGNNGIRSNNILNICGNEDPNHTHVDACRDWSSGSVTINGGKFDITAVGDGIRAQNKQIINGGRFEIDARKSSSSDEDPEPNN